MCFCICTHIDLSDYGVSWDKVLSMSDYSAVIVANIKGVLSKEQVQIFLVSNSIDTRNLLRQLLLNHKAKAFVYTHHSQ